MRDGPMPDKTFSASDTLKTGNRTVLYGITAIVVILIVTAVVLFRTLPDANAFNDRVERIFVENQLTARAEITLLEILAQSGTAFSETLTSYRIVIFVLLVFELVSSANLFKHIFYPRHFQGSFSFIHRTNYERHFQVLLWCVS